MIIDELMCQISSGTYDERLMEIYVDDNKLSYQKQRYVSALRDYMEEFGSDDVEIYSAPGRSEIGGNSLSISIAFCISLWSPIATVAGLCIIIVETGDISTVFPAIAITDAADAAIPSILTVTLPL